MQQPYQDNTKPFTTPEQYQPPPTQPQHYAEPVYNPNIQQFPQQQPIVNYSHQQQQFYPQQQMIPNVQQQVYQPPVMIQQVPQPMPTMPPVAANNMMDLKQKMTTTTFQNLISQKSSTLQELVLQNQDGLITYLCCASLGFFRMCSLRDQVSHITMLPSEELNNSNNLTTNQKAAIAVAATSKRGCCGGCCDGCCNCNGCCSFNSCNCDGDGVLVLMLLLCIILILSLAILAGLYLVTAPIALFLIIYHEKITLIEFDDEKREIRMTSRARYLREHFIFSTYTVSYDQIHDIRAHMIKDGKKKDYCLALISKDGRKVNISKPLDLTPDDVMSGATYLREYFRNRGVVLVDQFMPLSSTSTIPITHQMV